MPVVKDDGFPGDAARVSLPDRELNARRFDRVAVNHQIKRRKSELPGQTVQSKVLGPYTRMVEVGLMAGGDHWADRPFRTVRRRCPLRVIGDHGEPILQFAADLLKRPAANADL